MSLVNPIPDGYNTVSVYLVQQDCDAAIKLYQKALNAVLIERIEDNGVVIHAEIRIGNSVLMLGRENPEFGCKSPKTVGGTPVSMYLYIEDADALFSQAKNAGFEVMLAMQDMPWGDRFGQLRDPFGHEWSFATHVEDLSESEISQRMKEAKS